MPILKYPANIDSLPDQTFMVFTPLIPTSTTDNEADQSGGKPVKVKKTTTDASNLIYLYHPEMAQSNSQIEWDASDAGVTDTITSAVFNSKGVVSTVKNVVGALRGYTAEDIFTGGNLKDLLAKQHGRIVNPRKNMFFRGIGFREFAFTFNFAPESEAESIEMRKIILMFKKYSHPENQGAHLSYPPSWNIDSKVQGKRMMNFKQCVITAVNVDLSPNQVISTFQNGMPVNVKLEVSFKEMAIIESKDFDIGVEGFGY